MQPSLNINHFASCQNPCQKNIVAVIMRLLPPHCSNVMPTDEKSKQNSSPSAKMATSMGETTDMDDEAAGRLSSTDLHRIVMAAMEGETSNNLLTVH